MSASNQPRTPSTSAAGRDPQDPAVGRTPSGQRMNAGDFHQTPLHGTARIIIASTRASDGTYEDRTGPMLVAWLRERGMDVPDQRVVPDGPEVGREIGAAIEDGADVVITSGGTGITPSDVTPEQTRPHLDYELPGILEEVRRVGAAKHPASLLSRGLAGMAGTTLVVNLPGSRGGVRDGIGVLDPILGHLLEQRHGRGH